MKTLILISFLLPVMAISQNHYDFLEEAVSKDFYGMQGNDTVKINQVFYVPEDTILNEYKFYKAFITTKEGVEILDFKPHLTRYAKFNVIPVTNTNVKEVRVYPGGFYRKAQGKVLNKIEVEYNNGEILTIENTNWVFFEN